MTSVPQTKPPTGFIPWIDRYGHRRVHPRDYRYVQLWRAGQLDDPPAVEPINMHPWTNVWGLYWRPVVAQGMA